MQIKANSSAAACQGHKQERTGELRRHFGQPGTRQAGPRQWRIHSLDRSTEC
jgi:hypothetical protein